MGDTLKFWQWRQFGNQAYGLIKYLNVFGSWVTWALQMILMQQTGIIISTDGPVPVPDGNYLLIKFLT